MLERGAELKRPERPRSPCACGITTADCPASSTTSLGNFPPGGVLGSKSAAVDLVQHSLAHAWIALTPLHHVSPRLKEADFGAEFPSFENLESILCGRDTSVVTCLKKRGKLRHSVADRVLH